MNDDIAEFKVGDLVEAFWMKDSKPQSTTGIITKLTKLGIVKLDSSDDYFHANQCKRIKYNGEFEINKEMCELLKVVECIEQKHKMIIEERNSLEAYKKKIDEKLAKIAAFKDTVLKIETLWNEVHEMRQHLESLFQGNNVNITSENLAEHVRFIITPHENRIAKLEEEWSRCVRFS